MSATPSIIFFYSELNDPGSSFDVFLGALGPSVARPRHSDKHPNLGNCGRSFRDLSVEINVSGKTHRANRGELVEGSWAAERTDILPRLYQEPGSRIGMNDQDQDYGSGFRIKIMKNLDQDYGSELRNRAINQDT